MASVVQFAELPGNTRTQLAQNNPHKTGTEIYKAYELFKCAQTINEAKKAGASFMEFAQRV